MSDIPAGAQGCFRIWIDGELMVTDYAWPDTDLIAMAAEHVGVTDQADAEGKLWLLEVEDLLEEEPERRFMRFGTDTSRMVNPVGPFEDHISEHPWAQA